ncbi:hypothetical protein Acr_13g0008980 [Actinidia rufa]|uniref:Uncharacterized protein n=1 Tax=Actinidia rufa TaxID=165716 RepID=A0A7J0FL95_9ERIC|nr:hypothetical protein Acr_13g0008980 [Actinidia rufa]
MGIPTGEKGVLKLVYPGGYVEIHTEPITAAEVMRKKPRHCVARPDVFKFPYIVVRPESVLFPGRVFYVVPNRTIYRLLKARGELHNQPPRKYDHRHQLDHDFEPKQTQFHKPWAGTMPKPHDHDHDHDHDRCLKKQKQVRYSPWDGVSDDEDDSDEGHIRV